MFQPLVKLVAELFTRPRPPLPRGLVGLWVSQGNDQIEFSRGGRWSHSNAKTGAVIERGRFRVEGDRLVLQVEDRPLVREIPFRLGVERLEFVAYFNSEYRPKATQNTSS